MQQPEKKIKVLFLCVGNACRSQIAEGWARHLKSDVVEAYSAGVAPAALSQPAVEVMAEAGVDISGQFSKHVDLFSGIDFDYVVTLCDNANALCPVFSSRAKFIHRPFEDPSFLPGTEQQRKEAFIKLRDRIKDFVEKMPQILEKEWNKRK